MEKKLRKLLKKREEYLRTKNYAGLANINVEIFNLEQEIQVVSLRSNIQDELDTDTRNEVCDKLMESFALADVLQERIRDINEIVGKYNIISIDVLKILQKAVDDIQKVVQSVDDIRNEKNEPMLGERFAEAVYELENSPEIFNFSNKVHSVMAKWIKFD